MKDTTRLACLLLASLASASCTAGGTRVEFYIVDGYRFSPAERREVERIVHDTVREARLVLPALHDEIVVRVRASHDVIPETGENGSAFPPNVVAWDVDPRHPGGVSQVARTWLRPCLAHELHHLVRHSTVRSTWSLMDRVVSEGLATAFERDSVGSSPPWGAYDADASSWVQELRALPPDLDTNAWMSRHPDGRRWIGYKAGTFLVDRAMAASGRSSADLVTMPTAELIDLAVP